jgi:uncharacterized Fe-S cluster protein YjdI
MLIAILAIVPFLIRSKKESINFNYAVWQPEFCIHSGRCVRGLPEVFKPKEKPWITPEGSTTEKIIAQVKKCPSGALSYFMNDDEPITE